LLGFVLSVYGFLLFFGEEGGESVAVVDFGEVYWVHGFVCGVFRVSVFTVCGGGAEGIL